MSLNVVQRGNRRAALPGTCNQTGNKAPRFKWPPAIRVLIHRIAHHLDYTDDQMARLRDFPNSETLYTLFVKTVPWFPDIYDESQLEAAARKGYDGPLGLFSEGKGPVKVYNRLLYLFTEPKDAKGPRRYGIGVEHPDNPQANRRGTDMLCSQEIMRRLKLGLTVSQEEVREWSR